MSEKKKQDYALMKYYKRGWLDKNVNKWYGLDRLGAGLQLAQDFTDSGFSLSTIDFTRERIDCSGFRTPSDFRQKAEQRFREAIRAITDKFYFRAVQHVVIEGKTFTGLSQEELITKKIDLQRGLDCLCEYYSKKLGARKSNRK